MIPFFRIYPLAIAVLLLCSCDNTEYHDHQGNHGHFTDFKGRWLVINYWATWCKPCIEEIPELNQFSQQHDNTAVFGVNYDGNHGDKLLQDIDKLGIEFPVLTADPSQTLGFIRPSVLPSTLIFDPNGTLYKTLIGPQTAEGLSRVITGKNP